MTQPQPARVVADGWGSGSVFCADSSLRYIYEGHRGGPSPAPGSSAAALSSLSAASKPAPPSYPHPHAAYGLKPPSSRTVTSPAPDEGVDLFEAEIARACAAITRRLPTLPPSYQDCAVCLTPNAYAQIAVCGHTFHSKCFLRWFRLNRSCPMCRGPVDRIHCAEPVVDPVRDELEALMAEMDDDELPSSAASTLEATPPSSSSSTTVLEGVGPLMANPEQLMSFLGPEFDTDMDMMPLEDLPLMLDKDDELLPKMTTTSTAASGDVEMLATDEIELKPLATMPTTAAAAAAAPTMPPLAPAMPPLPPHPPMQFAPSSTMPNYWNVLNQGLAMPAVLPAPAPPVAPPPQQRMVHIAPKPNTHGPFVSPHQQLLYGSHATTAQQRPTTPVTAPVLHPFLGAPTRAASPVAALGTGAVGTAMAPKVVSCRCTGGCRNGRCACVKEGGMCGISCRCTSCKNPFLMVKAAGADIDALLKDACFMHNVSKTRDMVQRMQEPVEVPCCEGRTIKVLDCVQGYTCTPCKRRFDFSWCLNKLLDHDRTPRNHCEICKRCCDHRDVHCHDCGRCYFAGVAASLPCPCKESSRKRREPSESTASNATAKKGNDDNAVEGEEKDGECTIM